MAVPEILIFDDDSHVSQLMQNTLEDAGYPVQVYADGTSVHSLIEDIRPRLIILDIMMPGLDGLSACRSLRANTNFKDLRIAVCSGKTVGNPSELALRLGADLYIQKPFKVNELIDKVQGLIGAPIGAGPIATTPPLFITVLGCRSAQTGICVALEVGETLLILDAGPGLRNIDPLLTGRKNLYVIFSHYHQDHVGGLGHLRGKNLPISLFGPSDVEAPLRNVVGKYLSPKEAIKLYTIVEGTFELTSQVRLSGLYVNHPGTTLALRIEAFGKNIVFCPDNEVRPPKEGRLHDIEDKLKAFARNADMLIHDARYTPEDYPAHVDEGHSSYSNVVDLAIDAGVKRLMLTHLDPSYGEEKIKNIEMAAQAHAQEQITDLEVFLAREDLRLTV